MRKEMVQICNYIVGDKAIIYELLAIKKAANKKPKNRDSETALSLKTESSRPGPPGGGGGEGYSTKFYTGRLRPEVQTLTL